VGRVRVAGFSLSLEGSTTFHFVTGGIRAALDRARDAAGARDLKIGGSHPRPVSPKLTRVGTNPTTLHALVWKRAARHKSLGKNQA
jgi:hypothetical protein